jgi:DNA-binding NarL/FixJ family response regulator
LFKGTKEAGVAQRVIETGGAEGGVCALQPGLWNERGEIVQQTDSSSIRTAVILLTGQPANPEQCSALWSRLIRYELTVALHFADEQREYLVLSERAEAPRPLDGRNLGIVERFLLGDERKAIAIDFGLSPSTIAQILKSTLSTMGLDCAPFRAPSQLVLLAHGAHGCASAEALTVVALEHEGQSLWALSEELDRPLFRSLPPAQRAVLRQLIQGRSYVDIAARRRTAYRTVANQVASACQRLGVSGRSELLQLLASPAVRRRRDDSANARLRDGRPLHG